MNQKPTLIVHTLSTSQLLERISQAAPYTVDTNVVDVKTEGMDLTFKFDDSYEEEIQQYKDAEQNDRDEILRLEDEVKRLEEELSDSKDLLNEIKQGETTLGDVIERMTFLEEERDGYKEIVRRVKEEKDVMKVELTNLRKKKGVTTKIMGNYHDVIHLITYASQGRDVKDDAQRILNAISKAD
jgi:chromosome segregation ATPase